MTQGTRVPPTRSHAAAAPPRKMPPLSWCVLGLAALVAAALGMGDTNTCPAECTCSGLTVSCGHRGLTRVPRHLPHDAQRM